jgi:hypothetical protein
LSIYHKRFSQQSGPENIRVVEITKGIEFPVLLFNSDEELLDSLECQLVSLDENPDGVRHEFGGHFQNIVRKGSGDDNDLSGRGKVSVDIVNLVLETLVEQFIRLVKNEHLNVSS